MKILVVGCVLLSAIFVNSEISVYQLPEPVIYSYQEPFLGNCHYRIAQGGNRYLNYEWQFGGSAKQAVGTNGFPITNCSVTGPADCIFEKAVLGVTNYVAVRSEFGGMYSKWSNVMACD